MSDKNKTEEPVDAEFETLDTVEDGTSSGEGAGTAKPVQLAVPLGIAGLVIIIALVGWIFVSNNASSSQNGADAAILAELTTRVDTIQNEIVTRQSRDDTARDTMLARLNALETSPSTTDADQLAIADIQTRLSALEKVQVTVPADANLSAVLGQRLGQLEAQMSAMSADVKSADPVSQDVTAILTRLDSLENAVPSPVQPVQSAEQTGRLGTLEAEVHALQVRLLALEERGTHTEGTSALALGILALDNAAQSGKPFAQEWRTLAQYLPQNSDVLMMGPLASTGVPSQTVLVRSFSQNVSAIRAAGDDSADKPGIFDKVKKAMGAIVSIRRTDGNAKGVDAILARAEAALADDDLSGAVQELGTLDGAANEAAQGWVAQANARVTLEQAIARLKTLTDKTPVDVGPAGEVNP